MKIGVLAFLVVLIQFSAFSQGTLPMPRGSSPSYATGTLVGPPPGVTGSAADVRSQGFDGAGYFTGGGTGVDTGLELRLGNGVSPFSGSGPQIEAVPEPSSIALGALGLLAALSCRLLRKKAR